MGMGEASSAIRLSALSSLLRMSSNINASTAVKCRALPSPLRISTPLSVISMVNFSLTPSIAFTGLERIYLKIEARYARIVQIRVTRTSPGGAATRPVCQPFDPCRGLKADGLEGHAMTFYNNDACLRKKGVCMVEPSLVSKSFNP